MSGAIDPADVPVGAVVLSSLGTIAGRYSHELGVVLGDERPFPWERIAGPVQVLHPVGDLPDILDALVADLRQMDLSGAIELARWPAARRLVAWADTPRDTA